MRLVGAWLRRRPHLLAPLLALGLGTPYAALATAWVSQIFIVSDRARVFWQLETVTLVSAAVAPACCALWVRAPIRLRRRRAILAAWLATLIGWAAVTSGQMIIVRSARAGANGVALGSADYLAFMTEGYRIGWTLWIGASGVAVYIVTGSFLTLFTPWATAALVGYLTWRWAEVDKPILGSAEGGASGNGYF